MNTLFDWSISGRAEVIRKYIQEHALSNLYLRYHFVLAEVFSA